MQKSIFILSLFIPMILKAQGFDSPPQLGVGDNWTYQFTDLITQEKKNPYKILVTKVDFATADGIYTFSRDDTKTEFFKNKNLNPTNFTGRSVANSNLYSWPMQIGSKIKTELLTNDATLQGDCKVASIEKTVISAGEFEAAKIECRLYARNTTGGENTIDVIVYFAPKVKNFIKYELKNFVTGGRGARYLLREHYSTELLSYESK